MCRLAYGGIQVVLPRRDGTVNRRVDDLIIRSACLDSLVGGHLVGPYLKFAEVHLRLLGGIVEGILQVGGCLDLRLDGGIAVGGRIGIVLQSVGGFVDGGKCIHVLLLLVVLVGRSVGLLGVHFCSDGRNLVVDGRDGGGPDGGGLELALGQFLGVLGMRVNVLLDRIECICLGGDVGLHGLIVAIDACLLRVFVLGIGDGLNLGVQVLRGEVGDCGLCVVVLNEGEHLVHGLVHFCLVACQEVGSALGLFVGSGFLYIIFIVGTSHRVLVSVELAHDTRDTFLELLDLLRQVIILCLSLDLSICCLDGFLHGSVCRVA